MDRWGVCGWEEALERQAGGGARTAAELWSCVWGHRAGSSCTPPPPSPGTAAGSAACCAGLAVIPGCGWSVAVGERSEVSIGRMLRRGSPAPSPASRDERKLRAAEKMTQPGPQQCKAADSPRGPGRGQINWAMHTMGQESRTQVLAVNSQCRSLENKTKSRRDFPGGPVVKNLPSTAGVGSLIPGRGPKIP